MNRSTTTLCGVRLRLAVDAGAAAVCGPGFGAEFYKLSDAERFSLCGCPGRTPAKRTGYRGNKLRFHLQHHRILSICGEQAPIA